MKGNQMLNQSEMIKRASDALHSGEGAANEPLPTTKAVMLFEDQIEHLSKELRTGLIAFQTAANRDKFDAVEVLSEKGCLEEAARNLCSAIRKLDAMDLDLIAVQRLPHVGLGVAINDRLARACC